MDIEMVGGPGIPDGVGAYRGGSWAAWHEPLRVTRWTTAPGMATVTDDRQPIRHPDGGIDSATDPHAEADRRTVFDANADTAMQRRDQRDLRPIQSDADAHAEGSEHTGGEDRAMLNTERPAVLPADGGG